jgi:sulfur relay (sulfurtransferase) DsrC/TusE family protein
MLKIFAIFLLLFVTAGFIDNANGGGPEKSSKHEANQNDKHAAAVISKNPAVHSNKDAAGQNKKDAAALGNKDAAAIGSKVSTEQNKKDAAAVSNKVATDQSNKVAAEQGSKVAAEQSNKDPVAPHGNVEAVQTMRQNKQKNAIIKRKNAAIIKRRKGVKEKVAEKIKKEAARRRKEEAAEAKQKIIEYIELVMEEYGTPVPISRVVKRDKKYGHLYSSDKSMQTILHFVYEMLNDEAFLGRNRLYKLAKDMPEDGCYVTFSVEKDMNPKAYLFDVGTTVLPNDVEDLEIFEESETGRREIRQKAKTLVDGKSAEENRGKDEDKIEEKEAEEDEEEEEEEEEDEEGDEPAKLRTLAAILAIQKGRKGFGNKPYLNYKNLPNGKDQRLLKKIDYFFQQLIDACDKQDKPKKTTINGKYPM